MTFQLLALRLSFVADDPIRFPFGTAANTLRGALGTILRRIACSAECTGPATCARRASCFYSQAFAPSSALGGPSGLADRPRPFVLRTSLLDGQAFTAGDLFHFDLHLFNLHRETLTLFIAAFQELGKEGLGPGRKRVHLSEVRCLDSAGQASASGALAPLTLTLNPPGAEINSLQVRFLTPTEIKEDGVVLKTPTFSAVASRARDRISTLRANYGRGPLPIDFKQLSSDAASVEMTDCKVERVEIQRRSTRTGNVHSIGGFTGTADYKGRISAFVPYLQIAYWTGIGRHTTWGNGAIAIFTPEEK